MAIGAASLSKDGSVIVGNAVSQSVLRGFRWSPATGVVLLGKPADEKHARVNAISTDGTVIVGRVEQQDDGENTLPFDALRWTACDPVAVDKVPGLIWSSVEGVSGNGKVSVGCMAAPPKTAVAYRWVDGVGQALPVPPGPKVGRAYATNADGSVVVGFVEDSAGARAFRWTNKGDAFIGEPGSAGLAVNAAGTIVVGGTFEQAFLWTESGGFKGLGYLGSTGGYAEGRGVSDDGAIVVGMSYAYEGGVLTPRPFVWDPKNGMRELDKAAKAAGVDLGDMELSEITAVSPDGKVMVGYGTRLSDPAHGRAWRLRLP